LGSVIGALLGPSPLTAQETESLDHLNISVGGTAAAVLGRAGAIDGGAHLCDLTLGEGSAPRSCSVHSNVAIDQRSMHLTKGSAAFFGQQTHKA
jgi:hypothetical protein